jgi:hypothetical protein
VAILARPVENSRPHRVVRQLETERT